MPFDTDAPSSLLEMYSPDAPPMRVTPATRRFRPVLLISPPESATVPVFTIRDAADSRTLGDLLACARAVEGVPDTEARVAFVRDAAGRIQGIVFGTRVTPPAEVSA